MVRRGASLSPVSTETDQVDGTLTAESPHLPPALQALDAGVRGISGVLDVEQVLQLIVDRVRELVGAQYAALGIVDEAGLITQFITSGIS